jgi:urease accessory protein
MAASSTSSVATPEPADIVSIERTADLALARVLRLASPMLPVGAFSYSQGLESAIEQGWVRDEASAQRWIGDVLECNVGRFEAIVWCRLYRAWQAHSDPDVCAWNDAFLAARESAEFRAETVQMGYSLRKLLCEGGEFDEATLAPLRSVQEPAFPTAFSFACAAWPIPERQALLGYLWAWIENQVSAAMKAIPLGQMSGQRLLAALSGRLGALVEAAIVMKDEDITNCAPGLAIASCRHEIQYSRLFRS